MKRRPGRLRIIGGQWRSRLVEIADEPGLRPTPDRVRQTLFDWLAPCIEGARVADLFAGSGALGLEALSRGAAAVSFVEQAPQAAHALRQAVERLGAVSRAQIQVADALQWLASEHGAATFDIAFLDPPYASALLVPALEKLVTRLAPFNRVYLEWPDGERPELPQGYAWLREKSAGRVSYGLITFHGAQACP